MFARTILPAGFVALSLLTFGCKNQSGSTSPSSSAPISHSSAQASAPAQTPAPTPGLGEQTPLPPAVSQSQPPDDAALLARKTSEYAQHMSPLMGQQGASPATRPSVVEWIDPSTRPAQGDLSQSAPIANRPVTLAAAHLKEDTSLPLILPESADQIPTKPNPSSASPIAISTDEYEQKLAKLVHDFPRDLGNQLDYQLIRFIRDEPTPDLTDVTQLSAEDRDILLALMDGLNNFRAAARSDGNLMLNRKIQPLLEMADRLRSEAQLAIPTVAFCSQVSGYGVYRPMPTSRFPAGRDNDLIVYCEAANFTSLQGNDHIWRTRLKQEMVLYTDGGLAVWPEKSNVSNFVDQSRNRRHDFFISRRIKLPSALAVGHYVLKITLTDEESNRVVEASTPLEITPGPTPVPADAATAADRAESVLPALAP